MFLKLRTVLIASTVGCLLGIGLGLVVRDSIPSSAQGDVKSALSEWGEKELSVDDCFVVVDYFPPGEWEQRSFGGVARKEEEKVRKRISSYLPNATEGAIHEFVEYLSFAGPPSPLLARMGVYQSCDSPLLRGVPIPPGNGVVYAHMRLLPAATTAVAYVKTTLASIPWMNFYLLFLRRIHNRWVVVDSKWIGST